MEKRTITTRDEAIKYAIDWQKWAGEQSLSWHEVAEWGVIFKELGDRFGLSDEFSENGII